MNTQPIFIPYLLGLFRTFLHIFVLLHLFYQWREWYNATSVSLFYVKEDWRKQSDISYHIFKKIDVNHPTIPTAFSC